MVFATRVAPALAAGVVLALVVVMPLLGLTTTGLARGLRAWQDRRGRTSRERRARALMSEMCPNGWRAQITVGAGEARSRVALDWAELSARTGEPLVSRRVWGETIDQALDAMVSDRCTDETLERIEREAVAQGIRWPE